MAHESTVDHENDLLGNVTCGKGINPWLANEHHANSVPIMVINEHNNGNKNGSIDTTDCSNNNNTNNNEKTNGPEAYQNGRVTMKDRQNSLVKIAEKHGQVKHQSSVPHLFAETPKVVTHHHDTDDEDTDHSDNS